MNEIHSIEVILGGDGSQGPESLFVKCSKGEVDVLLQRIETLGVKTWSIHFSNNVNDRAEGRESRVSGKTDKGLKWIEWIKVILKIFSIPGCFF